MSEIEKDSALSENQTVNEVSTEKELTEQPLHEEHQEHVAEPAENFSNLSKEEMVKLVESFAVADITEVKSKVPALKEAFDALLETEKTAALSAHLEQGGAKEDFKFEYSKDDDRFQEALRKFNKRKAEYTAEQEKLREDNLKVKQDILTEMKNLIQNEDNMQRAFEQFHELQARWRSTGPVPQGKLQDLWLTYKLYTDKFYELLKINRELQELDYKRNLDAKITICEKAEELVNEPSLNTALQTLQFLQNKWRETGRVSHDKSSEIWERFKAAGDKVYERRREYYNQLKQRYAENLEAKNSLIGKLEELMKEAPVKANDWVEKGKAIVELQNEWKKIGYADKKSNDEVWEKFRGICDKFFSGKNEFFTNLKREHADNLQAKNELCMQAEALAESSDWKKTTEELKRLQQEWKKTGSAGERHNQKVWERFRKACDAFFARKSEHYTSLESEYKENLERKNALIEKAEQFVAGDNGDETVEQLKELQREWSAIGMVPLEHKDTIYARFKAAIDKHFQALRQQNKERFTSHSRPAYRSGKPGNEKNDIKHRMNQLSSEINTWENNLGFFAKSKNADGVRKEFEEKINRAKEEIQRLKKQLDTIALPAKEEKPEDKQ